jgi:hypothetical protein
MTRKLAARLLGLQWLLLSMAPSATSGAEPLKLVLVPAGAGPGLEPTVMVAQALARRLTRPGQRVVKLAYFVPEIPEPADLKVREKHASKLLKKAFAAFDVMEYEKVKAHAGEALKIFKALLKSHPASAGEGYVSCLHLLAASALVQGESTEANQLMNDAVLFDPRPPSKRIFNPSVQELYETVRSEPSGNGTLLLHSTPTALVWFNGTLHGLAQGRVSLRGGLYLAKLFAPGHAPVQRWVRVRPHQERPLKVSLAPDGQPENETMARLREEAGGAEPGPTFSQAVLDLAADELILLTANKSCRPAEPGGPASAGKGGAGCVIRTAWFKEGRWHRRRQAPYAGQPGATAAVLSGARLETPTPQVAPPPVVITDGPRACTLDSQCLMNERCQNGRCVKPKSVTRTWWFWSLVGAATVGVTLAIVLPLTRPEGPTIEVR